MYGYDKVPCPSVEPSYFLYVRGIMRASQDSATVHACDLNQIRKMLNRTLQQTKSARVSSYDMD